MSTFTLEDAINLCIAVRDDLERDGTEKWHGAQRCVMALNVALLGRDCQFNEEQQATVENATLAKIAAPQGREGDSVAPAVRAVPENTPAVAAPFLCIERDDRCTTQCNHCLEIEVQKL